jgi:hypothetical protein
MEADDAVAVGGIDPLRVSTEHENLKSWESQSPRRGAPIPSDDTRRIVTRNEATTSQ